MTAVLRPRRDGRAGMPAGGQGPSSSILTTTRPRIVAAKIIASDTMNTSIPMTPASVRATGSSKGVMRRIIGAGSGLGTGTSRAFGRGTARVHR